MTPFGSSVNGSVISKTGRGGQAPLEVLNKILAAAGEGGAWLLIHTRITTAPRKTAECLFKHLLSVRLLSRKCAGLSRPWLNLFIYSWLYHLQIPDCGWVTNSGSVSLSIKIRITITPTVGL